jgi:MFS family permease
MNEKLNKNLQYYKFCLYGFFKNLRFFDAFLLLFFLENGLNYLEIGFLYSIREIAMVFLEIPSGVIADTLGRKRTLVTSFFIYILSFILFYYSSQFVMFALAMLLFAVGDSFRTGTHKAMIYHYLKKNSWGNQKVNYYGHTRSWSQVGTAISSLVAGIIVFYSGEYSKIFLYSIIPYLLDMLLVWSYPDYLNKNLNTRKGGTVKQNFKEVAHAFITTFRSLAFIRALSSTTLYTGYYRAIKDYFQPLLKYFALSMPFLAYLSNEKKVAVIIGVIYFFTYLLTAVASRNSGRFAAMFQSIMKPMNLTILVGFIIGIVTGLTFSYGYFVLAIAGFIIILLIENLRKPIGVALVADLSKESAMASVLSASSQAKSLIAAIIAPIIGILADLFNPGVGIAATTLLLFLSFPLYWLRTEKA